MSEANEGLDNLDRRSRWDADERGWFGGEAEGWGGRYMPEALVAALDELTQAWAEARADAGFRGELDVLLRDFVGRPTPLYRADRLSAEVTR